MLLIDDVWYWYCTSVVLFLMTYDIVLSVVSVRDNVWHCAVCSAVFLMTYILLTKRYWYDASRAVNPSLSTPRCGRSFSCHSHSVCLYRDFRSSQLLTSNRLTQTVKDMKWIWDFINNNDYDDDDDDDDDGDSLARQIHTSFIHHLMEHHWYKLKYTIYNIIYWQEFSFVV